MRVFSIALLAAGVSACVRFWTAGVLFFFNGWTSWAVCVSLTNSNDSLSGLAESSPQKKLLKRFFFGLKGSKCWLTELLTNVFFVRFLPRNPKFTSSHRRRWTESVTFFANRQKKGSRLLLNTVFVFKPQGEGGFRTVSLVKSSPTKQQTWSAH